MAVQDEFSFIDRIRPKTIHQQDLLITGIGDDAAVYHPHPTTSQIICTDTLVEGIHFTNQTMSPFQIGYKALAVNISDIAAMGGTPLFYLVSIAIPKEWEEDGLFEIYKGMQNIADTYKMDLIGGDTVSSMHSLMITVTVIGETEKGKQLLRSQAKDGDIVFVTGTIGDSSAGLELLLSKGKDFNEYKKHEKFLVERHQLPNPRVEIGRILSTLSRVSLNDISDGISSEANEIAEASGVTLTLNADELPLSKELSEYAGERALNLALYGGEDFELIGTMSSDDWNILNQKGQPLLKKVGYVTAGSPKVMLNKEGALIPLEKKGYNHFK